MGRPIPERFFNGTGGAASAGGEGVLSITVTTPGNNYSQGATITFADSPLGGTTATGTIAPATPQQTANLWIASATVTANGAGYTSAPAITIVKPGNVTVSLSQFSGNLAGNILTVSSTVGLFAGMHISQANIAQTAHIKTIWTGNSNVELSGGTTSTFNVAYAATFGDVGRNGALTAVLIPAVTTANTIQANAWISTGAGGRISDILSQKGSRRYRVTNNQGTDTVRLVPTGINGNEESSNPTVAQVTSAGGPVAAGQMTIQASDSAGGTYWVGKLEGQTALVFPGGTGTPGTEFAANTHVIWSMNAAVSGTTVKLATND